MSFDLFVDSSANIPDGLIKARAIRVIPYTCLADGKERSCCEEGRPFSETAKAFYNMMRAGKEMKTSLIPKERIVQAVLPSFEAGRDVFLVTISSGISGTYAQATAAKKELEARFPARKMMIGDSSNASMGEGLLALRVADLRDMGESVETCAEWFEENRYKVNSFFTVGDLRYLRKGGRISAAAAIAGALLNIKPVLTANGEKNASIIFHSKERGRKRALGALLAAFDRCAVQPQGQTVAITHADCEADAIALADALKERGVGDVIVEYYDLCSGAHVGPDTVALFFWGQDRRGDEKKTTASADLRTPVKAHM